MKSSKETTDSGQKPGFVATPEFHADSAESGGHFTREKCEAGLRPSLAGFGRAPDGRRPGYMGVHFDSGRWHASITVSRRRVNLGAYDDPVSAAEAYDRKAIEIRGPLTRINFPATPPVPAGAAAIQLSGGRWAIVDEADFADLNQFRWHASLGVDQRTWYAQRQVAGLATETMHGRLARPAEGQIVDHKNWDGLDNRRENLRVCTYCENNSHQRMRSNNTSGFKGVSKGNGTSWRAHIAKNKRQFNLGTFRTAYDAAIAYDAAAQEMHGEFAVVNNVHGPVCPKAVRGKPMRDVVLAVLAEGPVTLADLADRCGLERRLVQHRLKSFRDHGLARHSGGVWKATDKQRGAA